MECDRDKGSAHAEAPKNLSVPFREKIRAASTILEALQASEPSGRVRDVGAYYNYLYYFFFFLLGGGGWSLL